MPSRQLLVEIPKILAGAIGPLLGHRQMGCCCMTTGFKNSNSLQRKIFTSYFKYSFLRDLSILIWRDRKLRSFQTTREMYRYITACELKLVNHYTLSTEIMGSTHAEEIAKTISQAISWKHSKDIPAAPMHHCSRNSSWELSRN